MREIEREREREREREEKKRENEREGVRKKECFVDCKGIPCLGVFF